MLSEERISSPSTASRWSPWSSLGRSPLALIALAPLHVACAVPQGGELDGVEVGVVDGVVVVGVVAGALAAVEQKVPERLDAADPLRAAGFEVGGAAILLRGGRGFAAAAAGAGSRLAAFGCF